jgi:predicted nucleic acid-binding Zn ribbon protein
VPTYVYKFIDTGETIEIQQAFTDDSLTEATHPKTGAVLPIKKVFLPVGVTFKGGGFYKTDSRGGSGNGSSSSSTAPASTESSSSSDSGSSSSDSGSSSKAADSTPSSTATPAPSATPAKTSANSTSH